MLLIVALVVGIFIGAVGVGGVLLIPAIHALAPLPMAAAMGTALFTFIFTGVASTWWFQRRGSIDWGMAMPLGAGAIVFGAIGAWVNAHLDARPLALVLATLIVAAGAWTLVSGRAAQAAAFAGRPRAQRALLLTIGAVTGFGSGLTGVGGTAVSVPLMVLSGFPTLAAVGASQAAQIVAALSGSAGFLSRDLVDLRLAAVLVLFEVAGVWLGVSLAHRVGASVLRSFVGVLCVVVGLGLVWRWL